MDPKERATLNQMDAHLHELRMGRELRDQFKKCVKNKPKEGRIIRIPKNGPWGDLLTILNEKAVIALRQKQRTEEFGYFSK